MIKLIKLGGQIESGADQFAWYDTEEDRFLEFGGAQVFHSWTDFEETAEDELEDAELADFRSLFPKAG